MWQSCKMQYKVSSDMNQVCKLSNPSLSPPQPLHTRRNKRLLLKVFLENLERESIDKNVCSAFLCCCPIYFHIPFIIQLAVARKITTTLVSSCPLPPSTSPCAWVWRPEDPKPGVELIKTQNFVSEQIHIYTAELVLASASTTDELN